MISLKKVRHSIKEFEIKGQAHICQVGDTKRKSASDQTLPQTGKGKAIEKRRRFSGQKCDVKMREFEITYFEVRIEVLKREYHTCQKGNMKKRKLSNLTPNWKS